MEWVPRSMRGTMKERSYRDTLYEGVPAHLRPSLLDWLSRVTLGDIPTIRRIERRLQISLKDMISGKSLPAALELICVGDPDLFLDIVDAQLSDLSARVVQNVDAQWSMASVAALHELLAEAGSAWTVAGSASDGGFRLEGRVNATARAQADAVISSGTDAGREIAEAWAEAYGRSPDTADAYRHAVLAVEAVAGPLFIPNDKAGTLGKAITHLKTNPQRYTLVGLDRQTASGDTLLQMLQTLWTNQPRHAEPGGAIPEPPTPEAAQAAVTLAVTLVQLFQSGAARPASQVTPARGRP